MKPIIGISVNISPPDDEKRTFSRGVALHLIQHDYIRFVEAGGGIPIMLPVVNDPDSVAGLVERLDGVLVTGGVDVDPELYGEQNNHAQGVNRERDNFEINLVRETRRRQLPLMGICRGMQAMNVAFGGSLYQDIPTSFRDALRHTRAEDGSETYHQTKLIRESFLNAIFDDEEIRTNSSHHQSVKDPGEGLTIVAEASDGIVEAVQCFSDRCTIGVQWHPERMHDDASQVALVRWFIEQAGR